VTPFVGDPASAVAALFIYLTDDEITVVSLPDTLSHLDQPKGPFPANAVGSKDTRKHVKVLAAAAWAAVHRLRTRADRVMNRTGPRQDNG
jgi:hypothetical protein